MWKKKILKIQSSLIILILINTQFFWENIYAQIKKRSREDLSTLTPTIPAEAFDPQSKKIKVSTNENKNQIKVEIQYSDQLYVENFSPFLFDHLSNLIQLSANINQQQKVDFRNVPHKISFPLSKENFIDLFSTWLEMVDYYAKHGLILNYQPSCALYLAEQINNNRHIINTYRRKSKTPDIEEKYRNASRTLSRLYEAQKSANILNIFPLKDVLNTAFSLREISKKPLKNPFIFNNTQAK